MENPTQSTPSHSSQHLPTPSIYTKQVGLPILSCPQKAADADQVCNAPETTQRAESVLPFTLMHECAVLSLSLNTDAQCKYQAVSWPQGSCVLIEGASPGGLNSLEQEKTRLQRSGNEKPP